MEKAKYIKPNVVGNIRRFRTDINRNDFYDIILSILNKLEKNEYYISTEKSHYDKPIYFDKVLWGTYGHYQKTIAITNDENVACEKIDCEKYEYRTTLDNPYCPECKINTGEYMSYKDAVKVIDSLQKRFPYLYGLQYFFNFDMHEVNINDEGIYIDEDIKQKIIEYIADFQHEFPYDAAVVSVADLADSRIPSQVKLDNDAIALILNKLQNRMYFNNYIDTFNKRHDIKDTFVKSKDTHIKNWKHR